MGLTHLKALVDRRHEPAVAVTRSAPAVQVLTRRRVRQDGHGEVPTPSTASRQARRQTRPQLSWSEHVRGRTTPAGTMTEESRCSRPEAHGSMPRRSRRFGDKKSTHSGAGVIVASELQSLRPPSRPNDQGFGARCFSRYLVSGSCGVFLLDYKLLPADRTARARRIGY